MYIYAAYQQHDFGTFSMLYFGWSKVSTCKHHRQHLISGAMYEMMQRTSFYSYLLEGDLATFNTYK